MEIRTRSYPVEVRYYCPKCAVFVDPINPLEKHPGFKYLERKEFDLLNDHVQDDSVLNVMTIEEIIKNVSAFGTKEELLESLKYAQERTQATVKFYGEMLPQGPCNRHISPENPGQQLFDSLHQCGNPSCKHEIVLPRDYPYVETVVGRTVRMPNELQHPDDIIRNVTKKHVGSTVMSNPEIK